MKILVRNVELFEWEVPNELIETANKIQPNDMEQWLIDNYFEPDNISVDEISDCYYEYNGTRD